MKSPDLVVAFLQCDRPEYTRRTLDSFVKYAAGISWEGWYADDASTKRVKMIALAESHEMKPLVLHETRADCTPTTIELIEKLVEKYPPETPCLYLQNDFEFLRPLPLGHVRNLLASRPDVGWVRTAGHWNSGPDRPPIQEDWIKEIPPADWKEYELDGEVFEIGDSYFCHNPPPILPLALLYRIFYGSRYEIDHVWNARFTGKLCARFRNNVAIHIGHESSGGL